MPFLLGERFNIIKTSILSKLISQLNVSPIKILTGLFLESDKLNKQFT